MKRTVAVRRVSSLVVMTVAAVLVGVLGVNAQPATPRGFGQGGRHRCRSIPTKWGPENS